ncbi:hypothetical protein, partial [Allosediminivita pacifica]
MIGAQYGHWVVAEFSAGTRQDFLNKALSQISSFLSGWRSLVRQNSTCRSAGHGFDAVTAPRRHRCAKVGSQQSLMGGGH